MVRRIPTLGVLILVAVALCLSLSVSLARSAQPGLITATASPPPDIAAYLPLIVRAGQPPVPTATATSSATATSGATVPASATVASSATVTSSATVPASATVTSVSPTAPATMPVEPTSSATGTVAPSNTATATITGTLWPTSSATATVIGTLTPSSTATGTATASATSTDEPTGTATATDAGTATPSVTSSATSTATATSSATATATDASTATPSATSSATSTAAATATSSATATATATPGTGTCVANVFPIALNRLALENNQPYWYKPVPLSNPYAENAAIPSLNTTNVNSPRFRAYSTYNNGGQFLWARWNGSQPSGSTADLNAALTGAGTLGQGFSEFPPPQSDPAAIPLVNGTLESGDWLAGTNATAANNDGLAALDAHIANKTLLILPVYDRFVGNGNWPDSGYHIVRFVQVRLLGYSFGGSTKYFEFALVEDNKQCFGALNFSEKLEWYEVGAPYTYDLVIVQDYTASMQHCWESSTVCSTGSRRIDYAAASLREFVNNMLVVQKQQGIDHRLAYVTFNKKAMVMVPFNNDTNATLGAFKNAIGDVNNPRFIPGSLLTGDNNTASGISAASALFDGARTVDKNGNPVKRVVLLVTDGVANVFNDPPYVGVTNGYANTPFQCGTSAADLENAALQFYCPFESGPIRPPVKAMIEVANAATADLGIQFYAVGISGADRLDAYAMYLNEVAPDRMLMAFRAAEFANIMRAVYWDMTDLPCQTFSSTRIAAGASVTVRNSQGFVVAQGQIGPSGMFGPNLRPGSGPYTVEAAHDGVIAPQDPSQIRRLYTAAFTIPVVDPAQPFYNGLLTTRVQCP